ncbi:MAG: AEC family transporter [Lachnospiraceae bacterium]|nr:AEC family transporter [Lachnospiraceae bacterium]
MSTALILLQQIAVMFLLSFIGFLLYRAGLINSVTSKGLGNILIYVSLPAVIIKGFLVERSPEMIRALVISAALALAALVIAMLVPRLFFREDSIAKFAAAFSNPGFFGIPLITASLADGAVFYVAAFISFLNIFQWTYGVSLLTNAKEPFSVRKLLKAPFFIATCAGLVLFFTAAPIPAIAASVLNSAANLNTPLAMFVVGVYLAQTNVRKMVTRKANYEISLLRLVVLPLITAALLRLVPGVSYDLKAALLIVAACPVGVNIAVYAQLYDADYTYAVETVLVSTILSIITIPLIIQLV